MKKKVLVIFGGTSKEREVSIKSGQACIKAIKELKYKIQKFDPSNNDLSMKKSFKPDIIFNALHGKDGEDGKIQKYLDHLKIPYTGNLVFCHQ